MTTVEILDRAKKTKAALSSFSSDEKNKALLAMADALISEQDAILAANEKDVATARGTVSDVMIDRLQLSPARIEGMAKGILDVVALPDPVGEQIWERDRPSGIHIRKVRQPFGVIAVVFESRPNVFVDTAALCLKTSNAVILRGGKEAFKA